MVVCTCTPVHLYIHIFVHILVYLEKNIHFFVYADPDTDWREKSDAGLQHGTHEEYIKRMHRDL